MESVNVWHGMPVKRVGWMTELGPLLPLAKYSRGHLALLGGGGAGVAAAHRRAPWSRVCPATIACYWATGGC